METWSDFVRERGEGSVKQSAASQESVPTCPGPVVPRDATRLHGHASAVGGEAFLLLLVTHFFVDCYGSTLPTVQPLLADRFGLSLAQAGMLGGFFMFSSAVLQLPFGLVSDRLQSRHYSIWSPVVAAVFLTSLGLASGFGGLVALLLIGGMGVAAYHPHSTSQAGRVGAGGRGFSTALFIAVGTAGLALGPLYLTLVIERTGFESLWTAAIPAVAMVPLLLWRFPQPVENRARSGSAVDWVALKAQRRPLVTHYVLVVLRSISQVGITQFLSLYSVRVRGASFEMASISLSIFLLSSPVGSFLGGAASDRFGGRRVILASCVGSVPFLAAFLALDGWLSILSLFVGGAVLLTTLPVNVVMAQELVPSQASTTSALMMGFAWGVAGLVFMPIFGLLGDAVGLRAVFLGFVALPLLAFPIALSLPKSSPSRQIVK